MGMWSDIKSGFGYGLGGSIGARIGWEISGFVIKWLKRLILLVAVAVGPTVVGFYNHIEAKYFGPDDKPAAEQAQKGAKAVPGHQVKAKGGDK